jgi:hypothetical protein
MIKSKRKFQLSRESIRNLSAGQLNGVVRGGGTLDSLHCSIDIPDTCPFPSHGPCSLPCGQSAGIRCI